MSSQIHVVSWDQRAVLTLDVIKSQKTATMETFEIQLRPHLEAQIWLLLSTAFFHDGLNSYRNFFEQQAFLLLNTQDTLLLTCQFWNLTFLIACCSDRQHLPQSWRLTRDTFLRLQGLIGH